MLIGELASGALDIVGDVHGEIRPLTALLTRLGYDERGRHSEGRRLVFVGDLIDRGEDSPAVVRLVKKLIAGGRTQCILGNHEINILHQRNKEGNSWFYGEREERVDKSLTSEVLADEATRDEILAFFSTLPLALEREDLRVVHACWHEEHVATLRSRAGDVQSLGNEFTATIQERLIDEGVVARAEAQGQVNLREYGNPPTMMPAKAELAVRRQNENPIKVLSSGIEELAPEPFWAGGKYRFERRVPWWRDYEGPMTVVGHYWRSRGPGSHLAKGEDLFAATLASDPLGPARRVMVVDYSIGKRAQERYQRAQDKGPFKSALAAYRWPEQELVFSDH